MTISENDGLSPESESVLSQVRTREEFGAALTELRIEAGLSVRDVVRLVPSLSLGTASGWFSGQHVPTRSSEKTVIDVLTLLGAADNTAEWLSVVERVRARPGPRRPARRSRTAPPTGPAAHTGPDETNGTAPSSSRFAGRESAPRSEADLPGADPLLPVASGRAATTPGPAGNTNGPAGHTEGLSNGVPDPDIDSPYVGLRPYLTSEAGLFHGRSAEVESIIERLSAPRTRPLVVVGASGAGKSSLLAAGVAPRWSADGTPVTILRPDDLTDAHTSVPGLLVVDQLEELWADGVDRLRRARLLSQLGRRTASGLATVVALRADFFQAALAEPVLRAAVDDQVVIGTPDRDALAEIIIEPARSLGYTVEPSLVTLLLDAVAPPDPGADERSLLPLLSYVLLVCWERSRRRRITVADYFEAGGIEGVVRDSAETIYLSLGRDGQLACRSLFLQMVDVSSARTVRRHAPLAEMPEGLLVVATYFARAGLLTLDGTTVSPTHEVLFSSWPRLVGWIDADREGLRVLARLRSDAADWEASGRDDAALPTASATADYLRWSGARRLDDDQEIFDDDDNGSNSALAGTHREDVPIDSPESIDPTVDASPPGLPLTPSECQFLRAARDHHEGVARRDRFRIRTLTALAASLAVVTILALVASVLALLATDDARETRDIALSRSGAVSSTTALTADPALGRALALAAYRIHPTTQARSALLNTSRTDIPLRFEAAAGTGRVEPLSGTEWFASVSSDGVLRLFRDQDPAAGAELTLGTGERHELYGADLAPSGSVLAAVGQGGVYLIDVRDPSAPVALATLGDGAGPFHSVAFSPDGSTLAAGNGDGHVLRWSLSPRNGLTLPTDETPVIARPDPGGEPGKSVEALAWLPDSSTLLVANRTLGVKTLLDAGARGEAERGPTLSTGETAVPLALDVSRDGKVIAAGTTGRAVHRWKVDDDTTADAADTMSDAEPLTRLDGWNAYVSDVDFNDEGMLAAAGSDERLRVYDEDGALLSEMPASQVATGIRFTDENHLVTYSVDGLVRYWQLDRLGAASESNSIFQTASSADRATGVLGVTASELHYTIVDTSGSVPRETGRVVPDSGTRFSGSVAMSPDGRVVYAGLADGGIQVFTAPFGPATESAASMPVVSGVVVASPLSPDGRTLAVCSDIATEVGIIDVSSPTRPRLLDTVSLPDPCVVAEFSADSQHLVVPTLGPETVIIDTSEPENSSVAHRLTTGIGASPSAGYAHHSPLLATSGGDETIRIWNVEDQTAPVELASLPAPPGEIYWTAFSADDARLLITSSNGQVTVVDVSDPTAPERWAVLGATTDPLLYQGRSASPDGQLLAVGVEGAMWMWELEPDDVEDETCAGGLQLTPEEWVRYFPDTEPFDLCE